MYIDTHEQRPLPPGRAAQRLSLRPLVPLGIGFLMLGIASMVAPLAGYVLVLVGAALIVRTLAKLVPSSNGLEEHRQ
jgi:ABC-type thiamin/hydroxymethylpyrimidine transport system permease subunit